MLPSNGKGAETMKTFFKLLWQETEGQDLVEYALMVGMVAVAAVAAMPSLTTTLSTVFSKIGSKVTVAVP
jgi:pilus assembly protein Flp/PilA